MQSNEATPRNVRLLTALLLVGVFASGALAGAGVYHWTLPSRPVPPFPRFLEELKLSPDQAAKTREIGERHRVETEAIFREVEPRFREVQEQMEGELRTILNEEQRRRLDDFQARRRQIRLNPPGM